jgi:PEP-CTERM motif
MSRKNFAALAIGTASLLAAVPANATVTIYTDAGAFDADQNETVEDFNDTTLVPGLSITSNVGTIANNQFQDRVLRGGATTTFTFANPVRAFGGFFDLGPGGFGQNLTFFIDGVALNNAALPTIAGFRFFGFSSTAAFSSVKIAAGNGNGVAETYNLDNLRIGAVPEPATWAMLILGFGVIGGAMRTRQQAKVRFAV